MIWRSSAALAKLNGVPVTVVGHQRGKDTKDNIQRILRHALIRKASARRCG